MNTPSHFLLRPVNWLWIVPLVGFLLDLVLVSIIHIPATPGITAAGVAFSYALPCWIRHDSEKRGIHFPADLALNHQLGLICIPAYFYESRGFKGILLLAIGLVIILLYFWGVTWIIDSIYYQKYL